MTAIVTQTVTSELPAQREPSYQDMMLRAIDSGLTPEGLSKICELIDRREAKIAEQQFNQAISDFKAACPVIVKNKEAMNSNGKSMYRYADLAEILKVIDPILHRFGLSYSFEYAYGEKTTTTCTVYHVGGGKRSSTFSCAAAGTSIMNDPQKIASATTYGRRYSLMGVLGIVAENDDDGRKAGAADDSGELVTPEQAKELAGLMQETSANAEVFFIQYIGGNPPPTHTGGILARDYEKARRGLLAKKSQKAVAK